MRLQRQALSRGNLNAELNSLTAIGAQLPGSTLLHEIAPVGPVGERLRGPVPRIALWRGIGLDLVVLASGGLNHLTHALAREYIHLDRASHCRIGMHAYCLGKNWRFNDQSITQPHLDRRGEKSLALL